MIAPMPYAPAILRMGCSALRHQKRLTSAEKWAGSVVVVVVVVDNHFVFLVGPLVGLPAALECDVAYSPTFVASSIHGFLVHIDHKAYSA